MTIRQIPIIGIPIPSFPKRLPIYCTAIILIIGCGKIIITSINIFKEGCKAFKEVARAIKEKSKNKRELTPPNPPKTCFKKLKENRELRRKPFREAEEDIMKKALKLQSTSKAEFKGTPIGRYRTFLNMVNPFQKEYDALPESVKKELARENSLFLSGNLSKKAKFELMRNSDYIDNCNKLNKKSNGEYSQRFISGWKGMSEPVLDSVHNVFYKVGKNPLMEISAAILRYRLKELKIDNIILPKREFWPTKAKDILRQLKLLTKRPMDDSPKISILILEEGKKGILSTEKCKELYKELPPEVLKDIIANITRLFCFIEIGDLYSKHIDEEYNEIEAKIDLINDSGKYIVKTDNPDFPSACRFDNIPIQLFEDDEGNTCYRFVLVDLDVVRKPDHKTIEALLRMFPKHQQLIVDVVQETNPALFEGYEPSAPFRHDTSFTYPEDILSTRDEMIENYRYNKGNPNVEDKHATKVDQYIV